MHQGVHAEPINQINYGAASILSGRRSSFGRNLISDAFEGLLSRDVGQGCQIFLRRTYQNGGKCTKLSKNIPSGH
jgi:hypothetical protein